jgi:hypothetical protein
MQITVIVIETTWKKNVPKYGNTRLGIKTEKSYLKNEEVSG